MSAGGTGTSGTGTSAEDPDDSPRRELLEALKYNRIRDARTLAHSGKGICISDLPFVLAGIADTATLRLALQCVQRQEGGGHAFTREDLLAMGGGRPRTLLELAIEMNLVVIEPSLVYDAVRLECSQLTIATLVNSVTLQLDTGVEDSPLFLLLTQRPKEVDMFALVFHSYITSPLNLSNRRGLPLLHVAINADAAPQLDLLITWGADLSQESASGDTALQQAVLSGAYNSLRVLLSHGVDLWTPQRDGSGGSQMSVALAKCDCTTEYAIRLRMDAICGAMRGAAFNRRLPAVAYRKLALRML